MSEDVKAPRRYDATRRREQARQTRAAVLHSARDRFLGEGYAATTIGQIAGDAGVSVETVYKAFANKAGLLEAVFDVSVAGDDEPVSMDQRNVIEAIAEEPDAVRKLTMYAEHLIEATPRAAPVQLLARDAASADPAAAEVWAQMRAELLVAMTSFAANLAETSQLRTDISVDEARDILWTYHAPELYELLVVERSWPVRRYGEFLARALVTALIAEP
jgi:AcrR family transcriptional regulator